MTILAKEAERLLNDDTLTEAFNNVRADALEALATANVDDKTEILRLQQRVQAISDIRSELSNARLRTDTANSPSGTFA